MALLAWLGCAFVQEPLFAKSYKDHSSSSGSDESVTLSLQAIQSNFIGAFNPFGGNNGFPIPGLTTPTQLTVEPRQNRDTITLHIRPFTFSLTETGFLISEDLLPQELSPTSATWVTFGAGSGIEGHVFRDGSIRFSGLGNTPLNPGTYSVPSKNVTFSTKTFPENAKGFFKHNGRLVRTANFPISQGLSNVTGISVNSFFDYGEYYGLVYRDGKVYTTTTDNSFDNTTTPIVVFNKLNSEGKHLLPQVDVVPPGFANADTGSGFPLLGEESLSYNPTNPMQLATTVLASHEPFPTIPVTNLLISNDGGLSWNLVDPLASVSPLPTPPDYELFNTGDQQCIFDSFGNLFYAPLIVAANTTNPNEFSAFQYVVLSSDGGITWTLIDFITGVNPETFGLDYPIIATGPGPDGSSVTWLMNKQDVSFDEILGVGATLPVMVSAYQTTGKGMFVNKTHMEVTGSENGGYGTISVGPKGEVLIVGSAMNNTLGSLPQTNSTVWYSFNERGINGTFTPIKVVANSNTGYYTFLYTPQEDRGTWVHANAVIDNRGRWYLLYVDQPSPHIIQSNPNIFLIYSDDRGEHWSTPVRLNNDVNNTTFHIMPQLAIDPKTNNLAVTWLDCREDELDISTRLWGTIIEHGTLPRVH